MVGKSGSPHGGATRATIALQHFPGWVAAAVADEVHLTKAISLTCTRLWTSQARSGAPGSVLVFDFHYGSDAARPGFQGFIDTAVRVLPMRSGK
jgi:hypothetical protein